MEKILSVVLSRFWPLVAVALITAIAGTAGLVVEKECLRPAVADVYAIP